MSAPVWRISRVESRAREILGDKAADWMKKPHRMLSDLSPRELAETGEAGVKVVLAELERHEAVLRYQARSEMD